MLLVVLGAGASYDAIPPHRYGNLDERDRRWRPPLAKELFVDRQGSFGDVMQGLPECLPLVIKLQRAVANGRAVEEAMREIQDTDGSTALGKQQLTALRFFLQEVLWRASIEWPKLAHGATNFVDLVDRIEKWRIRTGERVAYVTFNYDLLLEHAFIPRRFDSIASYVASSETRLFKLHGSVNWARGIDRLPGSPRYVGNRGAVIKQAPELEAHLTDRFYCLDRFDRQEPPGSAWLVYPAIALPMTGKGVFECPASHLEVLRGEMANVDRMLVVGWKGQEDQFLDMLRTLRPRVTVDVVAPSEAGPEPDVAPHLRAVLDQPYIRFPEPTFSRYLEQEGVLEALLTYRGA